MAVKPDGTLIIETGVDLEGFQADCKRLQESAKRAARSVLDIEKNLKSVMDQLASSSSEAGSHADSAGQKAKSAQQEAKKAAKAAREAAKEADKAKKEMADTQEQKITITRMEESPQDDYDGPLHEPVEIDLGKMRRESQAATAEIERGMKGAAEDTNEFLQELKEAQKALDTLESQGKWFGDEDYDSAYLNLERMHQAAQEYKKDLISPAPSANPFGIDTLAGKIREAELELAKLADAGKGLGNEEFDRAYRKLALLKTEAKEYAKELAKTPEQSRKEAEQVAALNQKLEETRAKEAQAAAEAKRLKDIGDNTKISRQRIVDLNSRLSELKNRQKELESAGLGLGYQEYDKNAKKIEKLNRKLKKYENAVTGANKKTKKYSALLKGAADRVSRLARVVSRMSSTLIKGAGNGAKAIAGLNSHAKNTQMSLGKMLGTSLLFSTVFRAISILTSGIGEGFQNLAQYSDETNVSLSALMSALTRLKNSFATAFSPLLTVVSPILVTFINLISKALTYVGMFFAALTGQSSFVKAIGVQQDYRASLSSTADAADDAADATNRLADSTKDAEKANDSYLSGLDEVRRWETTDTGHTSGSGGNGGGSVPAGGIGGISPGDMFETVPIENFIKNLADKIKKLIKAEDWEGLGEFVADGINKGLQKVYGAISWKKVGPKITKFVDAFTRTFNSLVNHLDFDLLGRTVGAGVNTLVNTFNLLIGPGGIDFGLIGRKLSQGLRGAIGEIQWTNLGNLLGNYFMISWNILGGFISDMSRRSGAGLTGWDELGEAIGQAVNGAFSRISFSDIALTLTNGINGLFDTLLKLAETVEWDEIADNVSDGLNTAFSNLEWEEAGKSLNTFLSKLVGFLVDILEDTDWEELGRNVGKFLREVDWGGHLWSMVTAIAGAIGELFDGLSESGTAGKIAAFLGKAFIAVKIADITGIGSLVKKLVSVIGKKLITEESITSVAGKIKSLFSSGTSSAGDLLEDIGEAAAKAAGTSSGGGLAGFAKALAPLVGEAGLIVGVGVAATVALSGLRDFIEVMQGGNGIASAFGASMDSYFNVLTEKGWISSDTATKLFELKESLESGDMSAEEMKEATNQLMTELSNSGVTADQARYAFDLLRGQYQMSDEMIDALTLAIDGMNTSLSNSTVTVPNTQVAYSALEENVRLLIDQFHLAPGALVTLQTALINTDGSAKTAQDAFDSVIEVLESMGVNTEEAAQYLSEKIPGAMLTVESSVDTHMSNAQEKIETTTEEAEKSVSESMENMQSDTETAFGDIDDVTVLKWGNSSEEVKKNLRAMKLAASTELANMTKTVKSYSTSMYNIMTDKWEYIAQSVAQIIEGMTSNIRNQMNSVIGTVNHGISNINNSIAGIEAAMNFGPWTIPTATGSRTIGFSASFPRVPHVPYLASGAVIPPRSEFLAVLGDQKHGNNIEAPEDLLRKIVREESGRDQENGKVLHNVMQVNRRTLFEEMIEEAKLRQTYSGKNPFELT
ncbi:MAG TPA: hypothetical protein IAA26_08515 [Candidatus Blautia faecipullorum]|nr:hypothetical protein [Candidatus Blautia faecipullorum]